MVDAVNKCPKLAFLFPEDHNKQEQIAIGFFAKSDAGFQRCIGCIDGMLLWIEQPT